MLVERTADPSTSVGMTKGRAVLRSEIRCWLSRRSLHFGRDDKGEGGASVRNQMLVERTADPSTSVGMTKGRAVLRSEIRCWLSRRSLHFGRDDKREGGASVRNQMLVEPQIPPLPQISVNSGWGRRLRGNKKSRTGGLVGPPVFLLSRGNDYCNELLIMISRLTGTAMG
jgi:hypothetical protein